MIIPLLIDTVAFLNCFVIQNIYQNFQTVILILFHERHFVIKQNKHHQRNIPIDVLNNRKITHSKLVTNILVTS